MFKEKLFLKLKGKREIFLSLLLSNPEPGANINVGPIGSETLPNTAHDLLYNL